MATVIELDDFRRRGRSPEPASVAPRVPQASIIIPAFNEEAGLSAVLEKLYGVIDDRYEVIVVDDGSSDGTCRVARKYPCTVVSHRRNLGKGAALQTGIDTAQAERVIFIDADDSYPVEAIPSLAERLNGSDLVFGERDSGRDNIPFLNRLGNRFIAALLRILYGFKGTDPLTGFYGLSKEHFRNMQIRSSGFGIEAEIVLKAARMGLSMQSLPIAYRERVGASKLRAMHDGYRICQTILGMLSMYSPTMAFVIPGGALFLLSSFVFALLVATPVAVGSFLFQTNTLLAAGMLSLAGFQFATLGVALHLYGLLHKHTKPDRIGLIGVRLLTSPFGLFGGVTALIIAAAISAVNLVAWANTGFGAFTNTNALFFGAYLGIWGLQVLLATLFLSALLDDLKGKTQSKAELISFVDQPAKANQTAKAYRRAKVQPPAEDVARAA